MVFLPLFCPCSGLIDFFDLDWFIILTHPIPRVVHCHCSIIFSLFPNFLSSFPLFHPSFESWTSMPFHFVLVPFLGNLLTFLERVRAVSAYMFFLWNVCDFFTSTLTPCVRIHNSVVSSSPTIISAEVRIRRTWYEMSVLFFPLQIPRFDCCSMQVGPFSQKRRQKIIKKKKENNKEVKQSKK